MVCYRYPMIATPEPWDLPKLDAYLEAAMRRMGDNRDVMTDEHGEPYYAVLAAGSLADGRLRMDAEADCSAIGMPTNTPITVLMDAKAGDLAWFLGDVLIATTPRHDSPEEAGDRLGMDQLLAAHRKWVIRNAGEQRGR